MSDPWSLGINALLVGYRKREFSQAEVIESLRSREVRIDPIVCALTELLESAAGPTTNAGLGGIPVAFKDLYNIKGSVTRAGSLASSDKPAVEDASLVAYVRAKGAIPLAKTRTHEFGWGITTQHFQLGGTMNPHDVRRVPGGSSGGSAAAVAAGLVPLAFGTDTGGSIRIPAAFCGVVGFKPSYGMHDLSGVIPLAPSLDHIGFLTRDVSDALIVLRTLGPRRRRSRRRGEAIRAGIVEDPTLPQLVDSHSGVFRRSLDTLHDAGIRILPVNMPRASEIRETYTTIQAHEALGVHTRYLRTWPSRATSYGPDVRGRLEMAGRVSSIEYQAARQSATRIAHRVAKSFKAVDVLITPVSACGPSSISTPDWVTLGTRQVELRDAVLPFTVMQNLAGLPACVIPVGRDESGLPVGLQVTGQRNGDELVLSVASAFEEILGSRSFAAAQFCNNSD